MSVRALGPTVGLFVARALACLGLFLLLAAPLLLAQSDTTVVTDKTGLFGPVIDKFWPVVVTFLISLTVKIMAKVSEGFAKTSEPVKWVALYAWSLVYNLAATWLGIQTVDPLTEQWTSAFTLGIVQTGAAALVYKFGAHKVPAVEPAAASYPHRG